jgi:NAD(P)-dependent dehydrogenase (short-subunit alcohol dehydrogenase family)
MELKDKIALVTGASRGIGRAVARLFAENGALVAVHYNIDGAAAEETRASLEGSGHFTLGGDVSDPGMAPKLIEAVVGNAGGLDVLVNNAGIWAEHRIADVAYEEWRDCWQRTIDTNLTGPANLCYWAARHMMKNGGGRIVNISSRGAFRGEPEGPAYAASKAGLNAMSQSLAKALAPHGIFVSVVAPGFVETDMATDFLAGPEGDAIRSQSPLGRVARPEEVAQAVLFLASGRSDFTTGCIIDVNGASYLRT